MQEKIFKIKWDDELGEGWMNLFNLELCLFSKECIGGKAKDMVIVEELVSSRHNPVWGNEVESDIELRRS